MIDGSLCMRLNGSRQLLRAERRALPRPVGAQVLLRVRACAVCRTDLHIVDGELPAVPLPIVPGHEIVGEVIDCGAESRWPIGTRLGVPWLGATCGSCDYCRSGRENLCDAAQFTGYHLDGGYAQHTLADSRYCFELPAPIDDRHAAPLLCAGLIGYRALRMTEDAHRVGIYGFGAAAHIITQVARWQGREIYAFTREGDSSAQTLATQVGANWAGDVTMHSPALLDAAIIFAPVGNLVPLALRAVRKGGVVVCGGIHMSDIPQFPYALLWGERSLRSVANLTRTDALEFLALAPQAVTHLEIQTFALPDANSALAQLRSGHLVGAAVLLP